jgi:hypothetical protein
MSREQEDALRLVLEVLRRIRMDIHELITDLEQKVETLRFQIYIEEVKRLVEESRDIRDLERD